MKVTKQVKSVFVKPKGDGMLYGVVASDGEIYSTFSASVGKGVEMLTQGDAVEIEFVTNDKGFKNFTSLTPLNGITHEQKGEPSTQSGLTPEPEIKKNRNIHRQAAGKIAAMAGSWLDLTEYTEEERIAKFIIFWKTIEDRLNEL